MKIAFKKIYLWIKSLFTKKTMINQSIIAKLKLEASNAIIRINTAFKEGNHLISNDVYEPENVVAGTLDHKFKVCGTQYIIKATIFLAVEALRVETYRLVDKMPIAESEFQQIDDLSLSFKADPRMSSLFLTRFKNKEKFHSNDIGSHYLHAFVEWMKKSELEILGDSLPDTSDLR